MSRAGMFAVTIALCAFVVGYELLTPEPMASRRTASSVSRAVGLADMDVVSGLLFHFYRFRENRGE